jgi:hypothetical protein
VNVMTNKCSERSLVCLQHIKWAINLLRIVVLDTEVDKDHINIDINSFSGPGGYILEFVTCNNGGMQCLRTLQVTKL